MNGLTGFRWRFWPTARAIGLALAVLLTTACGPRYEPPLRVGLGQWMGYETLFLARDLGYYPQLPLRLVELASSTQAMDGLKVGKLDVAGLTMDEALTLAHEGVPIAIIWVMDISAGADAVVARPDIRQLAEIKGKRVDVYKRQSEGFAWCRT